MKPLRLIGISAEMLWLIQGCQLRKPTERSSLIQFSGSFFYWPTSSRCGLLLAGHLVIFAPVPSPGWLASASLPRWLWRCSAWAWHWSWPTSSAFCKTRGRFSTIRIAARWFAFASAQWSPAARTMSDSWRAPRTPADHRRIETIASKLTNKSNHRWVISDPACWRKPVRTACPLIGGGGLGTAEQRQICALASRASTPSFVHLLLVLLLIMMIAISRLRRPSTPSLGRATAAGPPGLCAPLHRHAAVESVTVQRMMI